MGVAIVRGVRGLGGGGCFVSGLFWFLKICKLISLTARSGYFSTIFSISEKNNQRECIILICIQNVDSLLGT